MSLRQRPRWLAAGGALLAPLGVWLGHTAEYVRVGGTSGLRSELFTSSGVAGSAPRDPRCGGRRPRLERLVRARPPHGRRARSAAAGVEGSYAGQPATGTLPLRSATRVPRDVGALALVQLALYMLQENLEAAASGVGGG